MARHVFIADQLDDAAPGSTIHLDGAEGHHAAQVARVRSGEELEIVDGRGRRVEARVIDVRRNAVSAQVMNVIDEPVPAPRLVVVQALAKGDRGERAVETLTEVGVDVIVPWSAAHSVSQWRGDKADRGVEKWRATARSSAKQARRSRVPDVLALMSTPQLRETVESAGLALLLDEGASTPISQCPVPREGDVVLVVGPEGGLSDAERESLCAWGAMPVRLGPTVLRTSTAGTVAAGIVLAATDRWR